MLDGVDLSVPPAGVFALVGANGSGKSTLIKCLLDLLDCDSGEIELFGQPHHKVAARAKLAYLPERFSPPAHFTTADFLHYLLALHGVKRDREAIGGMLERLDLPARALKERIARLSKGMAQKVGLAGCLLAGKPLLVLDEPMSGLDPIARVRVKRLLQAHRDGGGCVFFSSHILADVEEMADAMAVLHQGRVRYCGAPQAFCAQYGGDTLEQAYMRCVGLPV